MEYVFNSILLRNLAQILGVYHQDIYEAYNGEKCAYSYRINKGTFALSDLVLVCNKFHIPISKFIVTDADALKEDSMLPTKNDIIYHGVWVNIENKIGQFGVHLATANGVSNKDAAKLCKLSVSNFYDMFINENQRWDKILVRNAVRIFNDSKVYIGEYLVDKNEPIVHIPNYKHMGYVGSDIGDNAMNHYYYQKMVARNARLQKRVDQLEEENARLQAAINALQRDNNYASLAAEDNV